ncbi:hypothetical protein OK348_06325 [Flavobacterium sp. MXW15]|uniref:Uncharacterized protein n=1 Tax=Xanthomonas chitinilytica TaxID=2989819 RepID=A0ABT3JXZ7_9XANT|nr:hypothetical protein [Xanthomonas sp. H13-6]MCW4454408.1 hypothetical protein [Flavobacterium sp. MXW15]MCW4473370.1 hypothetical protein [Xanthomonas sp. H13-6]
MVGKPDAAGNDEDQAGARRPDRGTAAFQRRGSGSGLPEPALTRAFTGIGEPRVAAAWCRTTGRRARTEGCAVRAIAVGLPPGGLPMPAGEVPGSATSPPWWGYIVRGEKSTPTDGQAADIVRRDAVALSR